jgi:CubicO group peptidase (beta-lactamase class C family)
MFKAPAFSYTVSLFMAWPSFANNLSVVDLEKEIDTLMIAYDGENIPGASVAIYKDGEAFFQKNYGLRDLETRAAVTSDTNFRTASLSKAFTATAVMQLVEASKLDLNNSLTDLYEDFPRYGAGITVHHLLTHTSGLRDYEDLVNPSDPKQVTDADVLNLMMRQRSTYFAPGSRFRYSNTGYAVLAEIVSKISGMPFHDYLRQYIFLPLSMNETVAYVKGHNSVNQRAFGYSPSSNRYRRTDQSQTSAVLGDGGIYSSAYDFTQWYRMWDGYESVINPQTIFEMLTPNRLTNGALTNYGYGWFIDKLHGERHVSHTGSTIGQKHAISFFPDKHLAILILTNRENSAPWQIVERIAKFLLN